MMENHGPTDQAEPAFPDTERVNRALIYINRKSNGAPTAVSGDLDKKSSLEIKMVNSRN
jgi:hypothetical protein